MMVSSPTRAAECLDCQTRIEQDYASGIWLPLRCADCDAKVVAKGLEILQKDAEAWDSYRRREAMAATNLRAEIIDGRLTLDRLPELYAETRVAGGVSVDRYREIVQLVKDFVSTPPLLRTSNTAGILFIHGEKGVGKTWIIECAVGYAAVDLRQSAHFATPMQTWADIKAHDDQAKSEARILKDLCTLDLLAIDDLARKLSPTEWECSIVLQIIEERLRMNKPTIVSCNYDVKGLFELWSDANDPRKTRTLELLADRLADRKRAISIAMTGKSLRREK